MVKTKTNTSKKTVSKSKTQKPKVTSSQTEQKAAIRRILFDNSHVKTCSCCQFQYVPMIAKVKGMEDLLENICPSHEKQVLKVASSYLNDCIDGNMSFNRQELEQLISEARGEEIIEDEDSMVSDDVSDWEDFRFTETTDFDLFNDDAA